MTRKKIIFFLGLYVSALSAFYPQFILWEESNQATHLPKKTKKPPKALKIKRWISLDLFQSISEKTHPTQTEQYSCPIYITHQSTTRYVTSIIYYCIVQNAHEQPEEITDIALELDTSYKAYLSSSQTFLLKILGCGADFYKKLTTLKNNAQQVSTRAIKRGWNFGATHIGDTTLRPLRLSAEHIINYNKNVTAELIDKLEQATQRIADNTLINTRDLTDHATDRTAYKAQEIVNSAHTYIQEDTAYINKHIKATSLTLIAACTGSIITCMFAYKYLLQNNNRSYRH